MPVFKRSFFSEAEVLPDSNAIKKRHSPPSTIIHFGTNLASHFVITIWHGSCIPQYKQDSCQTKYLRFKLRFSLARYLHSLILRIILKMILCKIRAKCEKIKIQFHRVWHESCKRTMIMILRTILKMLTRLGILILRTILKMSADARIDIDSHSQNANPVGY